MVFNSIGGNIDFLIDRYKGRMKTLKEISKEDLPRGLSVKLTGTPVIQQKLGELINQDRKNTQIYSTLFVLIVLILTFVLFIFFLITLLSFIIKSPLVN